MQLWTMWRCWQACRPNLFILPPHSRLQAGWVHAFVALRIESDPFVELGGLVVSEHYRGYGIGRSLLAAVEGWVRRRGIKKLRVRTRSTRHDAQAFYRWLGFSQTKEQQVLDKPIEPTA